MQNTPSSPGPSAAQAAFPAPAWLPGLLAGERAALARAITAVENETPEARAVLRAIRDRLGRALVVGFTGAPGAGKSTLVSAYVAELRRRSLSVGVVAVDPSSPLTGGAILGDRIRMSQHAADPGVFIRSLASRGHLGGLSRTAARVIDVFDASGRDIVVVETVGTGQSEVEIAEIADVRVVVNAPGLGDDIQAIKAGILEIADVLVVNKSDLPFAERSARQLAAMAAQRDGRPVPVLRTSATRNEGVPDLADAIAALGRRKRPDPRARLRRLLAGLAQDWFRRRLEALPAEALDALALDLLEGNADTDTVLNNLLQLLSRESR
ncbi:methylmalonyl Co-A mutase-associated GTPase MeaB [Ferrovibrio sp.]|uniref:methylmalonyl Co-A mutase-associated GTPase MeaB n=1 Tax=Ferrovibrio sp. TaxID=1917215 RepID=UPI001B5507A7|nr:methylmalonyl Co-A mutase-associated GTPase MeaB [Ferrovibrio sp.]MBP7063448.1 methylmalonyl Co-A mutase-associated GTPase MeaB [Ferrovibrio sp.]